MPIETWFPTLILYEDLSDNFDQNFNNKVYRRAKELEKIHKPTTHWMSDTFNTIGINLKGEDLFYELANVTKQHVLILADEYKIDKKYNIIMQDLWINISPPGEYQEFHTHGATHFSAVFYVQTPENSGNIIFKPIQNWFEGNELSLSEQNKLSGKSCHYKPKPSLLLVFKSDLPHLVDKNRSNEDRVSIAMNFKFVEND